MSARFIEQVREIQAQQEWDDAQVSHLALEFIADQGGPTQGAFIAWLAMQAHAEEDDSPPRELVDPTRLVIGEEHHANTLYPGSDHSVSECPGQVGGCAFGPPEPEQETVIIQTKGLDWIDYSRCTPTYARRFLASVQHLDHPEVWRAVDWITKQPVDL